LLQPSISTVSPFDLKVEIGSTPMNEYLDVLRVPSTDSRRNDSPGKRSRRVWKMDIGSSGGPFIMDTLVTRLDGWNPLSWGSFPPSLSTCLYIIGLLRASLYYILFTGLK
jgi:hypothetical protein